MHNFEKYIYIRVKLALATVYVVCRKRFTEELDTLDGEQTLEEVGSWLVVGEGVEEELVVNV